MLIFLTDPIQIPNCRWLLISNDSNPCVMHTINSFPIMSRINILQSTITQLLPTKSCAICNKIIKYPPPWDYWALRAIINDSFISKELAFKWKVIWTALWGVKLEGIGFLTAGQWSWLDLVNPYRIPLLPLPLITGLLYHQQVSVLFPSTCTTKLLCNQKIWILINQKRDGWIN